MFVDAANPIVVVRCDFSQLANLQALLEFIRQEHHDDRCHVHVASTKLEKGMSSTLEICVSLGRKWESVFRSLNIFGKDGPFEIDSVIKKKHIPARREPDESNDLNDWYVYVSGAFRSATREEVQQAAAE